MDTATPLAKYPEVRTAYRKARASCDPPISQERLAAEAGITRRHYIRIEHGEHRPSPDTRDRIAEVLGVDPGLLPAAEAVVPPFSSRSSTNGS